MMKKLFAILLIVAMLIPMGVVAQAEEAEKKGFYMVNWTNVDNVDDLTNVYYAPYFWSSATKVAAGEANVSCPYLGASSISKLAEKLKELFDTYPEGARYINFCMPHDAVHGLAEYCFADNAPPLVAPWLDKFLKEYHSIGGKLDGLIIDIEYTEIYAHYIHSVFYEQRGDKYIYQKIVEHDTYKNVIRPQLVERGFKFYEKVSDETPEIYGIYPNAPAEYALCESIWDSVMRSYMGKIVTDCCAPIWDYYPDAVVSDYQSKNTKSWLREPNDNGGILGSGGNNTTAGNSSNENFYNCRPSKTFFNGSGNSPTAYRTIPGFTNAHFEETIFNCFLYDNILAKDTYLASDNGDVSWWIAHYRYSKTSRNAYYSEMLLHLGMLDPQIFLGYLIDSEINNDEYYEIAMQIVDDCLVDLTRMVGYADRQPIAVEPNWNHSYVLSGMYANGRNVWRLTPDTSKVSVENFKVEGTDPTFTVGGETITFPGGKIVETGKVTELGTCGYWIETPKDVMPVQTRSENYFRYNPAYSEDFDGFEVGMEYNYQNALPMACWEIKKTGSGASSTIAADPTDANNKVLALKGTYTLTNVKMPDNITAGDTYAKNQAWEISFTLPADMADDAELILLNGVPAKKKAKDQGIKITGGKLYYDQKGEYVEMAGVELKAGTKYTAIRDFDFTVENAYTCDYYLYDAEGKLVGKAKNIPTAEMEIPVNGVSFGTKNIAGEAVLLDDYRLYPTSVAADFYLYDAKTGMKVTETDKAREADTAYRLSWLNSTQKEKTYSVVAAYYDGETLTSEKVINEVKMAPNGDGVITGIVKNENAGQTMRVYLRNDNPADADDDFDGGSGKKSGANSDLIIIIAAAAAALVVLVVVIVVIVATSKKKEKAATAVEAESVTEAAEETEETPETEEIGEIKPAEDTEEPNNE